MRHLITLTLMACAGHPGSTSTTTGSEVEDSGIVPVPPPPATSTSAPTITQDREVYDEHQCPAAGGGAIIPKGAIIQAWACTGSACWPVPELLSVIRGTDYDEAVLDGCSGAKRFEIAWLSVE